MGSSFPHCLTGRYSSHKPCRGPWRISQMEIKDFHTLLQRDRSPSISINLSFKKKANSVGFVMSDILGNPMFLGPYTP